MSHRQDIEKAFDKKMKAIEAAIAKSALAVDEDLVNKTPVDKGRARSNWFASINTPSTEQTDSTTPQTDSNVSIYDQFTLGRKIFITNNLPYIVPLNNGTSQQAPAAFVDDAVAKQVRRMKEIFKQIDGGLL